MKAFTHMPWNGPTNYLSFTLGALARLLWPHRADIHLRAIPMVSRMAFAGLTQSVLATIQYRFMKRIPDDDDRAPIFVIGHWRSGTTLLQELLCLDSRHAFPNTFECMNPNHFRITEEAFSRSSLATAQIKRPMDDIAISPSSPQEDEFALLASGAPSLYDVLFFPGRYREFLARSRSEALDEATAKKWQEKMRFFLAAVMRLHPGRLVVKSPTHAFKLKLVHQLYPRAQFVHIVRNPYDVYGSTVKLWTELFARYSLQSPEEWSIEDFVLEAWPALETALDNDLAGLAKENYYRLRFEDLIADPISRIGDLYQALKLGGFEPVRQRIEDYRETHRGVRAGRYELSDQCVHRINTSWRPIFKKYDYETVDTEV